MDPAQPQQPPVQQQPQPVQQGYAPPAPPPPAAHSRGKRVIMIVVIGIVLVAGIAGGFMYMQKARSSQVARVDEVTPPAVPSETPVPSDTSPKKVFVSAPLQHMLIAYVEQSNESGTSDQLTIFDPEEHEPVATYASASESAKLKLLPWSPDGSRLPVFMYKDSGTSVELVWYDAAQNLFLDPVTIDSAFSPIALMNDDPEILPWWRDTNSLAVYMGELDGPGSMSILTIGTNNSLTKSADPLVQTMRSSRLVVEHPYVLDEDLVGTTVSVQTEQSVISHITPPGRTSMIVGLLSDSILMLNEEESSGSAVYAIDFLDPVTGSVKNTMPLPMEGWELLGAQLLFDQQHVVVHQIDTSEPPRMERFLKYNIVTRRPKLVFSRDLTVDRQGYTKVLQKTGQSFITTADGQWIVIMSNDEKEASVFSARIQHIDRNEDAAMCSRCTDISVFNPHVVFGRRTWAKNKS